MIFIISFATIIIALSLHEFMHAYAAYLLGDQTAQRMGRLTINPLAHIDPIGTLVLPLLLTLAGLPAFGWAKPVPYNPYNLRNQRTGPVLVAIAGPLTNLVLFAIAAVLLRTLSLTLPVQNLLLIALFYFAIVNASLALFNIVPIPPLDGSKILMLGASNPTMRQLIVFLEKYGIFILLFYILLDAPGLNWAYIKLMEVSGMAPFFTLYRGL